MFVMNRFPDGTESKYQGLTIIKNRLYNCLDRRFITLSNY